VVRERDESRHSVLIGFRVLLGWIDEFRRIRRSECVRNHTDNLLPFKPLDDFLKPSALLGVSIPGRGR
jgi:hypothetical protein